jgi:hypothetical protein
MLVTISTTPDGRITVHRRGCADLAREPFVARWEADVSSQREAALSVYPPAGDDYDPAGQWEQYDDLDFKPCVRSLPRQEP